MPQSFFRQLKSVSWQEVQAFLRFMFRRLEHTRLPQVAGNLTFTTVLALVPLLTIALALFTMFPAFGTLRASLEAYFAQIMMPKQIASTILRYLTMFTDKAGHVSIIGALGVLVAATVLMSMIERSFNQIWRIRKRRSILKRAGLYLTVGILGPFLLGISLTMTSHLYLATGGTLRNPSLFYSFLYAVLSIIWTAAAFTVLYVVIPNRTIHWREAVCGGLFAAVAFEIVKRLFAVFILQFPTYRTIYGALAAIPIFLLWIYLSWLITFAGAAFVAGIHYLWHGRWREISKQSSPFLDAMKILGVLYEAKEAGANEALIREATGFGLDEIESLLQCLQAAGWVERVRPDTMVRLRERKIRAEETDNWRLIANPDNLTLADVFRFFVFKPSSGSSLSKEVDQVLSQGLGDSLSAYFSRDSRREASSNHNVT